jgi:hypothetical protein
MAHIPSCTTAQMELVTFDQALESAKTPNGDYDIQNLYRSFLAQYDNSGDSYQSDRAVQRRNAKGRIKGRGYGVTDHLADTGPTQQTG